MISQVIVKLHPHDLCLISILSLQGPWLNWTLVNNTLGPASVQDRASHRLPVEPRLLVMEQSKWLLASQHLHLLATPCAKSFVSISPWLACHLLLLSP